VIQSGSPDATIMWHVVKSLIQEEVQRLVRRLLRRPDPPSRYAQIQVQRNEGSSRRPGKLDP